MLLILLNQDQLADLPAQVCLFSHEMDNAPLVCLRVILMKSLNFRRPYVKKLDGMPFHVKGKVTCLRRMSKDPAVFHSELGVRMTILQK